MEEESPRESPAAPSESPAVPLKRRKLVYAVIDEVAYPAVPADKPDKLLRCLARRWAASQKEHVGGFSTPFPQTNDDWRVSCSCFRHTGCHAGEGKAFQFRGCWEGNIFNLAVSSAGKCKGPERICRRPQKQSLEHQLTLEQRLLVHEAADTLLETGRKVS